MPHPAWWRKHLSVWPTGPPLLLKEPLTSGSGLADHTFQPHREPHDSSMPMSSLSLPHHRDSLRKGYMIPQINKSPPWILNMDPGKRGFSIRKGCLGTAREHSSQSLRKVCLRIKPTNQSHCSTEMRRERQQALDAALPEIHSWIFKLCGP